ncbi:MAG: four helix bundle protein [Desulfobacterales bacterium]|nr:four helix bundle protein [Desulfobacterales bacterium]
MQDHTKLREFELADELAILVYRVTAGFPKEALYGLSSQMRRTAVSTPSVQHREDVKWPDLCLARCSKTFSLNKGALCPNPLLPYGARSRPILR